MLFNPTFPVCSHYDLALKRILAVHYITVAEKRIPITFEDPKAAPMTIPHSRAKNNRERSLQNCN